MTTLSALRPVGPSLFGRLPAALRARDDAARARSPWWRGGTFHNFGEIDATPRPAGIARFLKWKIRGRTRPAVQGAPDDGIEVRPLLPEACGFPDRGVRVAWLGHSSFLAMTSKLRIAIDPIFGPAPLVPRRAPPPIAAADLPRVDLVLISHNHYDHLDAPSLVAILARNADCRAIVPPGLEGFLLRLGFRDVRALDWWESLDLEGGARVTALPAKHWSKRAVADAGRSHWSGYLAESDGKRLLYAGDTAWGEHFQAIQDKTLGGGGLDAVLMPIGGYAPRWFMRYVHMDPAEAAEAARVLGARLMLPCHHGTFRLADEPLGEPEILLKRAIEERPVPVRHWRPGEVVEV